MTVLRTVARRGFTDPVDSQDLTQGHELDWFVLTLANLHQAPWCKALMDEEHGDNVQRSAQVSNSWERLGQFLSGRNSIKQKEKLFGSWIVSQGSYGKVSEPKTDEFSPANESSRSSSAATESDQSSLAAVNKQLPYLETSDRSTAQGVLKLRKDLAWLSNWRGPAAEEAICLAQAMEAVLNTLHPVEKESRRVDRLFIWFLKVEYVHSNTPDAQATSVQLNLSWDEKQKWKARADEIEAVLSLWLYSSKKQEIDDKPVQLPPINDSWLREKGLRPSVVAAKRRIQHLAIKAKTDGSEPNQSVGDHPQTEALDDWEPLPLNLHDDETDSEDSDGWDEYETSEEETEEQDQENGHDSEETRDDDEASSKRILAVASYDVREKAYATEIFNAFMWAVARSGTQPIDNKSKLQPSGRESSGRDSLRTVTLQSKQVSKLAQDIQGTGLESLYDAYLSIIPPFSECQRLPEPNAVTEQAYEQGKEHERLLQWKAASRVYAELLDVAAEFSQGTLVYAKTVAICVRYIDARKFNMEVRNFHDWGELYDYPSTLKRKSRGEEARLTRRLTELEGSGSTGQEFQILRRNLSQLCEIQTRIELSRQEGKQLFDSSSEFYCFYQDDLDEDWEITKSLIHLRDAMGRTPLHYAVGSDDQESAKELLKFNASSNAADIRDLTPLHYACKYGHTKMVDLLLSRRAKVDTQDHDGLSPLHLAALEGHDKVAEKLMKFQASTRLRDNYGRLPIHCAAMNGHDSLVKRLIADEKAIDSRGRTALHHAAWFGKINILNMLLVDTNKSDLESIDYLNCTPLHLAAEKGHTEAVKCLLSKGADPEAKCRLWNSISLHLAAARGHEDVVISLIERAPYTCEFKDSNRRTPLEVAQLHGKMRVCEYLMRKGLETEGDVAVEGESRSSDEEE
ncbi:ankyrin repeat [Fusarium albosuccineum]|uniref:Ankyrin repeat n=1 Tax=Fusarium albosuccineum TaxID=1237068 RepID=A0A8H4KYP9_9HYPO|nr:ankyrin repeat [Fusarium albosuccineum]